MVTVIARLSVLMLMLTLIACGEADAPAVGDSGSPPTSASPTIALTDTVSPTTSPAASPTQSVRPMFVPTQTTAMSGPTPTIPVAEWGNAEIYVTSLDGSDLRNLTNSAAMEGSARWAPAGDLIAYIVNSDRGPTDAISLMDPSGNPVGTIETGVEYGIWEIAWSPDGQQLAFIASDSAQQELWIVNVDGTDSHRVPGSGSMYSSPAWSPDGQQIAVCMYGEDGNQDIYLVNVDGSAITRLTDTPEQEGGPGWSPDGAVLVFTASNVETGGSPLFVVNRDGSNRRLLYEPPRGVFEAAWSPDGQWIAFTFEEGQDSNIYVIRSDGTDPRQITDAPHRDWSPSWSTDSASIAFLTDRDGGQPIQCSFNAVGDYAAPGSFEELVRQVDTIVVGTVEEQLPSQFGEVSSHHDESVPIYTDWIINVDESVKGSEQEQLRVRLSGGDIGDCHQEWSSNPSLATGARAVFLLGAAPAMNENLLAAYFVSFGPLGYLPIDSDGSVEAGYFTQHDGAQLEDVLAAIRQALDDN